MRLSALFAALIYLLPSLGVAVEVHYCLGAVADVNLQLLGTECACDAAHKGETGMCCEERSVIFTLDDDHQSTNAKRIHTVFLVTALPRDHHSFDRIEACTARVFNSESGPPICAVPLYQLYCSLRLHC